MFAMENTINTTQNYFRQMQYSVTNGKLILINKAKKFSEALFGSIFKAIGAFFDFIFSAGPLLLTIYALSECLTSPHIGVSVLAALIIYGWFTDK